MGGKRCFAGDEIARLRTFPARRRTCNARATALGRLETAGRRRANGRSRRNLATRTRPGDRLKSTHCCRSSGRGRPPSGQQPTRRQRCGEGPVSTTVESRLTLPAAAVSCSRSIPSSRRVARQLPRGVAHATGRAHGSRTCCRSQKSARRCSAGARSRTKAHAI